MVEIKTWRTKHVDDGWTGRLVGLSWRRGEVEEMWDWTAPEANNTDKGKGMRKASGKDKAKVSSKKDTGKTKGSSKKDTAKSTRKGAGKHKDKDSSKKGAGKGKRKHAGK